MEHKKKKRKKTKETFIKMYAKDALTIALISVLTIEFNFLLEKYQKASTWVRALVTFLFSFGIAILVFTILGLIFNEGCFIERLNGTVE